MLELVLYLLGVIICYAVLVWAAIDSMANTTGLIRCAGIALLWPVGVIASIVSVPFFALAYTVILLKSKSGK